MPSYFGPTNLPPIEAFKLGVPVFYPDLPGMREYVGNAAILIDLNNPKSFVYTCNAGFIENDHWIHDPNIGGGRLLGEACHFLDLLRFLADSPIKDMDLISSPNINHNPDNFVIQVQFNNGSIASINYFSNGTKLYPKERLEVFCSGTIHRLENFIQARKNNFAF